jgi:hypothetical protein
MAYFVHLVVSEAWAHLDPCIFLINGHFIIGPIDRLLIHSDIFGPSIGLHFIFPRGKYGVGYSHGCMFPVGVMLALAKTG